MNRIFIGAVIFSSGLAFFLLYLPQAPEFSGLQFVETVDEEGNYSGVQPVNEEPGIAAGRSSPAGSLKPEKGLEITLTNLSVLEVGDEIDLFIPQENRSYRGNIAKVDVTASDNRVLTGFFESEMRRHRFIFTVGESQTFGTLQTTQGRYQLEVTGGIGRIISTAEINKNMDFSKPDYVIPERREPAGQEAANRRVR